MARFAPSAIIIHQSLCTRMRLPLLAVLLMILCAACGGRAASAYDPNAVRMCIENASVGYGNVVAYVNSVRFTVFPGEEVCRPVRAAASGLSVRASTTGGGSTGPLRYSFNLPGGVYCWHWRVTNTRGVDIVDCDGAIY